MAIRRLRAVLGSRKSTPIGKTAKLTVSENAEMQRLLPESAREASDRVQLLRERFSKETSKADVLEKKIRQRSKNLDVLLGRKHHSPRQLNEIKHLESRIRGYRARLKLVRVWVKILKRKWLEAGQEYYREIGMAGKD